MRAQCTLNSLLVVVCLVGCHQPESTSPPPPPAKIGDLVPKTSPHQNDALLGAFALDMYIYNVPAKNQAAIRNLWKTMGTRKMRYKNHFAFKANALQIATTRIRRWSWIDGVLLEARAQKQRTVHMMIGEQQPSDLHIRPINGSPSVTHINLEGNQEQVRLRPGKLSLRMQALPMGDRYRLVGYPTLTLNISERIPALAERMRAHEIPFWGAAFSAPLQVGDVLVLGPAEHCGDESTLGGLLFRNDQGVLFMDPVQPSKPKTEPALRLFVFVCSFARTRVP